MWPSQPGIATIDVAAAAMSIGQACADTTPCMNKSAAMSQPDSQRR